MSKILVTRSSMPSLEEYVNEIEELWDSHWLTNMGTKHKVLQAELEKYLMVNNVELMVNGHMALEMAIQALHLEGEVITTPFTFASTTHAIVRNGLKPIFCDINEEDYTMDVSKLEKLVTERTTAIVPVHVYGRICNIEQIELIAKKYNLKVIYDAAHAFGETYKGRGIGSFGDASCFSFHATKVFNTIEGGAVCYEDGQIGETLYQLKNFGIQGPESVIGVGANAKMNEFCAAMGICNLRHIKDEIEKRKKLVEKYNSRLEQIPGIKVLKPQKDVESNYSYYPILINPEVFGVPRDIVFENLEFHNIGARKYFYPLTNSFECYNGLFSTDDTPVALRVSEQVLTLPLYADLSLEQIDEICDVVISCCKKVSNC